MGDSAVVCVDSFPRLGILLGRLRGDESILDGWVGTPRQECGQRANLVEVVVVIAGP